MQSSTALYEGRTLAADDVDSSGIVDDNPLRFSTKWLDTELASSGQGGAIGSDGLYYYIFRYYSPELGRWVSWDPIAERGGLNLYGFVGNGPTNRVDMLGLHDFSRNPVPCYRCDSYPCGMREDCLSTCYIADEYGHPLPPETGGGEEAPVGGQSFPSGEPFERGSRWAWYDFVDHYYFGNGVAVDLRDIALLSVFKNARSVRAAVYQFETALKEEARMQARLVDVRLNSSPRFTYGDQYVTDVTDEIFVVGHSTFFAKAECQLSACPAYSCGRLDSIDSYSYTCEAHYYIRDWFRDPLAARGESRQDRLTRMV